MIEEAINYPRNGDDALTTILIGGVLGLLSVLVVPFFLLLIVLGVTAGGVVAAAVTTGDVSPGAIAGAFLGFAISGLLWLVAFYVIPAALASFAREGRMGAAFDTSVLRGVLLDGRYATAWLVALVFFVVASVVVGVFQAIPPLGFVVGAFVNFYVGVAAAYLYGHAFVDASAAEVPPETGAQPAV